MQIFCPWMEIVKFTLKKSFFPISKKCTSSGCFFVTLPCGSFPLRSCGRIYFVSLKYNWIGPSIDPGQKLLWKKKTFFAIPLETPKFICQSSVYKQKIQRTILLHFEYWGLLVGTIRQPQRQKNDLKMIGLKMQISVRRSHEENHLKKNQQVT